MELGFNPFINTEQIEEAGVFVQGTHVPIPLAEESGIWFSHAGSAILTAPEFRIAPCDEVLWIIVEEGDLLFHHGKRIMPVASGECVVIPAGTEHCNITNAADSRLLWFTISGRLVISFLSNLNALNTIPAKQGVLPSMVEIIRQLVQVLVRHSGTGDASFQLQQILWSFAAMYSGQSVARSVTLTHEIARVVDAMRASDYRSSFSLTQMAEISRIPLETFRKRFTTELSIPPLSYLQFLKMEKAKTLLRKGISVRQAGVEIGMSDPYHFSKQFKRIVGVSPTAYLKQVGEKREK